MQSCVEQAHTERDRSGAESGQCKSSVDEGRTVRDRFDRLQHVGHTPSKEVIYHYGFIIPSRHLTLLLKEDEHDHFM